MTNPEPSNDNKLWTPMFVLIVGTALATFITSQGLNSGTTVYIDRMGGTALFAGYLASAFSVAAGVARISCGALMDTYGRRRFIMVSAVLLLISTCAPALFHDNVAMTICRIVQGASFGTVTTAMSTAAADVLPSARLGEGIGYFGLGQALAMAIGPAIAIGLAFMQPPELIFWGLSIAAALAFTFAFFANYEKHPEKLPVTSAYRTRCESKQEASFADSKAASSAAADTADKPKGSLFSRVFERAALPGAIPYALLNPLFGFGIYFIGLYGTTLDIGNPGFFFTFCAVTMVIVRLKSGAFMDTKPSIIGYTVAMAGGIICCVILIAAGTVCAGTTLAAPLFYGAGIFYGLCMGLSMPICQTVSVKSTPPERWGAGNALFLLSQDVGICLAVIIWGALNDTLGFHISLIGCIICIIASYVSAWVCFPAKEKQWKKM